MVRVCEVYTGTRLLNPVRLRGIQIQESFWISYADLFPVQVYAVFVGDGEDSMG